MKHCRKCGQDKFLTAFGKDSSAKDGLRSTCKGCTNSAMAARKAADPEKYRKFNRDSNKKRRAERGVEYLELRKTWDSNYRAAHPDVQRAINARRRARKVNAHHEPYSRSEIFARWDNTCCYCPAPAEHLDHVHPISKGGADAAHNLVPACAPCNLTKSNKSLADWASTF